nr:SDR family NAD(P)-dependent oxidoreductase [uncultured Cohaesibacter sp.]
MGKVPRSILITGASKGLGAALAMACAAEDIRLILTARSTVALEAVKRHCELAGAQVSCLPLDLADEDSVEQALAFVEADGLPDLVICNAGVFSGRRSNGLLESRKEQREQLAVNLTGTIHFTDCLAQAMKERRRGHLVLVSSLAAIQPQPDSPVYSASKAGLAAWGRALGEDLAAHGVKVSVVYPGHIESQQTAAQMGALPGIIPASKAASLILRGVARGRERIIFPRHLFWLILVSNALPGWFRRWVNRPFRYHVASPKSPSREEDG